MNGSGNHLSEEVKARIRKLRRDGLSAKLIADMCGVNIRTVWNIVREERSERQNA